MKLKKFIFAWIVCFVFFRAQCFTIATLGTGYVGLTTGTVFSEWGHMVFCTDIDIKKIETLNNLQMPIYEPGLHDLVVKNNRANRLFFTTEIDAALEQADCIIIAVDTPPGAHGMANMAAFEKAFAMIIPHLKRYKLICIKSTVPIGTANKLLEQLKENGINPDFYDVVSNPEFLKEGSAIHDCMNPDRIIIGATSSRAVAAMKELYYPLIEQKVPFVITSLASAETIKYASNAFLAIKLGFINEIANLCSETKADILEVALGIGTDKRIGHAFLKPGPGFGGSCLPKDLQALCALAHYYKVPLNIVMAALQTNEIQKQKPFEKLYTLLEGMIEGKTIALLGLAFKANTDDVRYSAAIPLIEALLGKNVCIKAYDPIATSNMKKIFPALDYQNSLYEAVENTDAIVIMTEWDEFKEMDLGLVAQLVKNKVIIDMRNILKPGELQKYSFNYFLMGRP